MDYKKFGTTDLEVSPLCLGCMSFGNPERGAHSWTLREEDSRLVIKQALELGVNFFDTANIYSDGSSEEIVGRALKDFSRRDEIVVATKVGERMQPGPNGAGLSRKAIFAQIDASLSRLGMDYVDLYQIHRWDQTTPIEETLQAMHDVVKAGKARYIGASNLTAWRFAKAIYTSRQYAWTRFVSMQNHLNLLYREEEREMLPLCKDLDIAVVPWSPLARGRLARAFDASTPRAETDEFGKMLYWASARTIIDAVGAIAAVRGVSRAQVSLAWLHQKESVTSPIIGATTHQHLVDAVASLALQLDHTELEVLERHYLSQAAGHYIL